MALRSEADTVFRKLRDIAAPSGTPFEHQSIGYAFGHVEAMLEKGHDSAAVAGIFQSKGRLRPHPLIVHIGGAEHLDDWLQDVPATAGLLAERFWPGPLTLVLWRGFRVSLEATGGLETVAVRVPDHPVALALPYTLGGGVTAPTANRFGSVSPTTADHVRSELGNAVDFVLDGGPCQVGVE